jgi:hypothetical protein
MLNSRNSLLWRILIHHRNNNLRSSSFLQLQDGLGRKSYLKRPKLEKKRILDNKQQIFFFKQLVILP